jgi:hypothetical protein
MSYVNIPRKSPRKDPVPTPSTTRSKPRKIKWTEEHELTLVYELLGLATQGVRQSFKGHFANITANLNKRVEGDGVQSNQDQVTKKIEKLRKNWKNFTDLFTGHIVTGAGWNEADNTAALDECQWEQLKLVSLSISFVQLLYELDKCYSSPITDSQCVAAIRHEEILQIQEWRSGELLPIEPHLLRDNCNWSV